MLSEVAEAVGHLSASVQDMAANMASDLSSEVASAAVAAGRSGVDLDSTTALPAFHGSDGVMDEAGKEHSPLPHSIWHGPGSALLVLVAVHLIAFLYWVYAYLINRKFETRKGETARKAVKKFKVVYEWSVQTALELSSAVRKKQAQSATSGDMASRPPTLHTTTRPQLTRNNSGFNLNKLVKAAAP